MTPILRLDTVRVRRPWMRALAAGWLLVVALAQAVPAAAQKRGAPASDASDGCSHPGSGQIPAELGPFVLPGTKAWCAVGGDLDGDGDRDYVLVLEQGPPRDAGGLWRDAKRTLLVVVRRPGGTLHVAARNDHMVLCAGCFGMYGDPFQGVEVEAGAFTVHHYGGSRWRWQTEYTFRYAPSAGTWRLAKVAELSFDSVEPEKMWEERIFVAPDDFGEIDLADFNRERWKRLTDQD
jgi:hypothetical protein